MYKIKSKVWLYPGMAGWQFITIPVSTSKKITQIYEGMKKGWGSLPVKVTIGKTTWETSIFPDKKTGTYLLPLKAQVRKKENIQLEDNINLNLEIRI